MKILIVDDEPDLCWALERMIRTNDMWISIAGCSTSAMNLLKQHTYTVAFVDAILPDSNGFQLARHIHMVSPSTSIVLMSGYYYREDMDEAHTHIGGFLAKPFLISDVRTILQQVLSADQIRQEQYPCNTYC
ncbi:MAG: response regulator [Chloroflexales bacterium]